MAEDTVADEATVGGPAFPEASTAAKTWALFIGIGLIALGNGLQVSLLGVRADEEGFGTSVTGLIMTGYFVGFLLGTRLVEHVLARVGHIRVFAAMASTASSAVLLHSLWVTPGSWAAMRLVTGVCTAGLYVVAESWLNDLSTNATRGRILAVYMVVLTGGMAIGQFLLGVADPSGTTLFVLASVLVSMSLVPVTLSAASVPPAAMPTPIRLRELLATVPTGAIGSFLVGAAQGTLIGLGSVYASAVGMTRGEVSAFVAAPLIGAVILQIPIGRLSDRVSRRGVIAVAAVAATAASLGVMTFDPATATGFGLMFLLGGAVFPLYSLVIAYTNDWLDPARRIGAAALLVRITGAGAIVGPAVAAGLMTIEADFYFWVIGVTHAVLAVYLLSRILVRDPIPVDEQTPFQPFPARASRMAVTLLRRRRRPSSDF